MCWAASCMRSFAAGGHLRQQLICGSSSFAAAAHLRRAGSGSRQRRQQAPRRFLPGILSPATVLVSLPLLALCPGRCVTCTDVQASYSYEPDQWHYFKQFCEPGVNSPRKVCTYQEVMEYFHVVAVLWQSAAQVLRDEDCPSMIIPSRPRSHPWTPGVRLGQADLFLALQSSLIRNALQRKLCLPKREHSTQAKVLT
ncbi:uncharacterized protein AAGF69_011582 [Amazona ochrocephala]